MQPTVFGPDTNLAEIRSCSIAGYHMARSLAVLKGTFLTAHDYLLLLTPSCCLKYGYTTGYLLIW